MTAVKGNREYTIMEEDKDRFCKDGFDIYKDGVKIAGGKGKTISMEAYEKLEEEAKQTRAALEEAKKQLEEKSSASEEKVLAFLKDYATLKNIDTGNATTLGGILKKIEAGEA